MSELFGLSLSPWELILRGTCVYWFLFLVFRFVLRRDVGSITVADVLVLVLIADAAQNAMAGDYKTITDGIVLVSTIVFWNFALDWAAFHFPIVRRLAKAPPLLLVRDGKVLHRNLRQEMVSVDELMTKLRENGVSNVQEVSRAYMEPDGEVSVLRRKQDEGQDKDKGKARS